MCKGMFFSVSLTTPSPNHSVAPKPASSDACNRTPGGLVASSPEGRPLRPGLSVELSGSGGRRLLAFQLPAALNHVYGTFNGLY